jgi:hypothetical protein
MSEGLEVAKNEGKAIKDSGGSFSRLNSLRLRLRNVLCAGTRVCKSLLVKTAKSPISLFIWCTEYTGKYAFIVKAIPALIMLFTIAYPWWSLPLWLHLSLSAGEPWCYAIYALWIFQWIVVAFLALTVEYVRNR